MIDGRARTFAFEIVITNGDARPSFVVPSRSSSCGVSYGTRHPTNERLMR